MTRRSSRAKKRVKRFVDALIVLCLLMCAIVTVSVLYEYHRLDVVLGAGEITALLAVWGASSLWSIGELFEQRERVAKGWFPKNPKRK